MQTVCLQFWNELIWTIWQWRSPWIWTQAVSFVNQLFFSPCAEVSVKYDSCCITLGCVATGCGCGDLHQRSIGHAVWHLLRAIEQRSDPYRRPWARCDTRNDPQRSADHCRSWSSISKWLISNYFARLRFTLLYSAFERWHSILKAMMKSRSSGWAWHALDCP